ncbi:hypothetical protein SOJ43_22980, partial [Pseudomonas aeruginosa]|uniref:hypothetical protein n=1 Tax=Pseudomonas aeruginosa TaxID=287 RepID=UPI002A6B3A80
MKVMKWSAIALAVSAGSTQFAVADAFVSDQAEAKGQCHQPKLQPCPRQAPRSSQ